MPRPGSPDDLVEEFEVVETRIAAAAGGRLQRRADQGGLRRRRAAAVAGAGDASEPPQRQLRVLTLGAGAVLGQGPLDRQPDDQRPDGDRRGEAGLPPGLRHPARLLPADGYFEWYPTAQPTPRGKPVKQPFFIRPKDGGVLAMAGLYEIWRDPTRAEDDPTGSAGPARCSPPRPRTRSATSTTGCR